MLPIDLKQRIIDLNVEQLITILQAAITPQSRSPAIPETVRDRLLNVRQAAELLGYEVSTIYDKTHRRLIPFMKKGRKIWFQEEELIAWAQSGKKETMEEMSMNLHLKIKRK